MKNGVRIIIYIVIFFSLLFFSKEESTAEEKNKVLLYPVSDYASYDTRDKIELKGLELFICAAIKEQLLENNISAEVFNKDDVSTNITERMIKAQTIQSDIMVAVGLRKGKKEHIGIYYPTLSLIKNDNKDIGRGLFNLDKKVIHDNSKLLSENIYAEFRTHNLSSDVTVTDVQTDLLNIADRPTVTIDFEITKNHMNSEKLRALLDRKRAIQFIVAAISKYFYMKKK